MFHSEAEGQFAFRISNFVLGCLEARVSCDFDNGFLWLGLKMVD